MRFRTMALTCILSLGALAADVSSAQAQCGGGGYARGWRTPGRSHGVYNRGGSSCAGGPGCGMMMGGMRMGAMNGSAMGMGAMPMPATQAAATTMPGMDMSGAAAQPPAPAAPAPSPAGPPATTTATAGATYYCPMHPGIMSTFPANCPTCGMALKRR
ncbi:MAG: heavy metal-binding domain-containing protein [Isosphaeraceae bacterium]